MKSLGIDIVEVTRIQAITEKYGNRFLVRVFTKRELAYCQREDNSYRFESLAGRFAAKEAFYKAASPLIEKAIPWHGCEIINDNNGAPQLIINSDLAKILGESRIHVSLSHTHNNAVAVVLID